MAPNTWPGWESVRMLGKGSYGAVYEIKRTEFGQEYHSALKVIEIPQNDYEVTTLLEGGIRNQDSLDAYFHEQAENILREVQMMAAFQGVTNIVSYEDHMIVPKESSTGYYILIRMELLTPLGNYLAAISVDDALIIKLGCDICNALEYCENNNIIHRDIKPANIFVSRHGDFKLGDFGIARNMASEGSLMTQRGTERYMAPEIYRGGKYGFQVDIYSLGLVLYQYLNENCPPFCDRNDISFSGYLNAHNRRIQGEIIPAPLHGSKALQDAVLHAIEFYPENRFSNAVEFREALRRVLDNPMKNVEGKHRKKHSLFEKIPRGKKGLFISGVVGAVIICALFLSMRNLSSVVSGTKEDWNEETSMDEFADKPATIEDKEHDIVEEILPELEDTIPDDVNEESAEINTEEEDATWTVSIGHADNNSESKSAQSSQVAGNASEANKPTARLYRLKGWNNTSIDVRVDSESSIREASDTRLEVAIKGNYLHNRIYELQEMATPIDRDRMEYYYDNINVNLKDFRKFELHTDQIDDVTVWTFCASWMEDDTSEYPISAVASFSYAQITDSTMLHVICTQLYDEELKTEFYDEIYQDALDGYRSIIVNN